MTISNARIVMACAAAVVVLTACSQAGNDGKAGASSEAAAPAASSGAVVLEARPDIREGVQALPRLAGDTPAVAAINADIDRINADTAGCEGPGTYTRFATLPMTGPGYVTVAIRDEYYCDEAARPSFDYTAITYDLSSGQRVDWTTAAPGLRATRSAVEGMPASYEPALQSENLAELYARKMLASTDAEWLGECRELFTEEMLADGFFKVWLDAQTGGLAVSADFPHVAQACAETATLNEEEMRRFGVTPAIIEAVLAATAAENFGPKG
jgi:hypothetical protein